MLGDRVLSLPSGKSSAFTGCIPMNSYNDTKQDINGICEGIGCYANATSKLSVKVGNKGQIILFLCEKCEPRFSDCEITLSL
jgi:hypothetical protein